jgi:TonB family protein
MSALLIYMLKTAIYLAGFYIIYFIFLSRDTQYARNRLFIILSVLAAFILPSVTVNIREQSSIYYFGKTLSEVFVTASKTNNQITTNSGNNLNSEDILYGIYIAGVIVFSLKLLIDIISLLVLISRNKKINEHVIYFKGFNTPGFSAMGNIFINCALGKEEAEEVIRHEQNHIDNRHFLDILLIEVTLVFQWFNPFLHFINRSLRAIHEYQADRGFLRSGMTVINYQKLLLNHVFRSGRINIYNSFSNPSLIKKRMIMMSKEPSGSSSDLKILIVIPVVALFLLAISACEKNISLSRSDTEKVLPETPVNQPIEINKAPVYTKPRIKEEVAPPPPPPPPPPQTADKGIQKETENNKVVDMSPDQRNQTEVPVEVFVVVEEMPTFPGGDSELMNYINANISYPETAKAKSIQGKVILRFAVLASGKVDNVTVLKSVDKELDNEAKRVVESLPDWTPGRQGGKPVNVWYSVPVTFQIK